MKFYKERRLLFALITILFSIDIQVQSQANTDEFQSTYNLAFEYFNNQKFDKALPYFARLLQQYAKDPQYNYHYGVCLLETGQVIKSIDYLRFSATQPVSPLVYFYLGKAYHLDYQFNKAITFYKRFQFNADAKTAGLYQADRLINLCYNAVYIMKYVPEVEPVDKKQVNIIDFYRFYDLANIGGKLIEKPTVLKSITDIEKNDLSIMFVPHVIESGDYVYYSGYTENNGKDIFRIRKNAKDKWDVPENLGEIINTPFDEDYVYPAADGRTLYFSSKGHYSMGGYDLYKTTFDEISQTWSPPENLDFPINSPYDDLFYITDVYNTYAMFASGRDSEINKITIYKIKINNRAEQFEVEEYNEIKELAKLNLPGKGADEKIPDEDIETKTASFNVTQEQKDEFEARYSYLLNKALSLQLSVDSLNTAIIGLRRDLIENRDNEEKNRIIKEITSLEEKKKGIEILVKEKFLEVKKLEDEFLKDNILLYIEDKRIRRVRYDRFPELAEVKNLFGLQNIGKIIDINEKILDNIKGIEKVEKNHNKIIELKALLKAEKDAKQDKKIEKSIHKLGKEIYQTNFKAYNDIHKNLTEKYKIYIEKIPEAKKSQENELLLEMAEDYISKAEAHFKQAGIIHQKIPDYESKQYIISELAEADSLDNKAIEFLEQSILSYFNYEIGEEEKDIFLAENNLNADSIVDLRAIVPAPPKVSDAEINADTSGENLEVIDDVELESLANIEKVVEVQKNSIHITKEFEISDTSPYSDDNPIPVDQPLPPGILYRIQLGVFSQVRPNNYFKGLAPINMEKTVNGYSKYFAGRFRRYQSAVNALKIVKETGFTDAFIVAYQDGINITTEKGLLLEPKNAPVINPKIAKLSNESSKDEVVIKIQIGAFKGTIPEDVLESYKMLASGKKVEQYVNENGIRIYTIGNFYNFDEAQSLKKYMVERGNEGIFLVAFKNGQKISVQEAKKLLENN